MGEWRRKWQGEQQGFHHQEEGWWWGPTGPPNYGRPPISSPAGAWHQKVPLWEKKFCTCVCSIPWKKLCETKKLMYMYNNIVQWNDSAGEEAFHNAKARFWAEINGLHCDIPLPDPDIYIDVVNQEAVIDPQLVEDLYKQPPAPYDGERDASLAWDSFIFSDKPVPVTGWGDEDDTVPTNGGEHGNAGSQDGGWGDGIVHDSSWGNGRDYLGENWENRNNESGRRDGRKRNGGRFGPRYMNPRYQGEDQQANKKWRNCRGRKRGSYVYEQPPGHDKPPQETGQWNSMRSCGPMNHQRAAESGGAWQWQKSIS